MFFRNDRQPLGFGRKTSPPSKQKQMFDRAKGNLRAFELADPDQSALDSFFLSEFIGFRIGLSNHRDTGQVEKVGPGRCGIHKHGAPQGVLAQLAANNLPEPLENRFSGMDPDVWLPVFRFLDRQALTLMEGVGFQGRQKGVHRTFSSRAKSKKSTQVTVHIESDQRGCRVDKPTNIAGQKAEKCFLLDAFLQAGEFFSDIAGIAVNGSFPLGDGFNLLFGHQSVELPHDIIGIIFEGHLHILAYGNIRKNAADAVVYLLVLELFANLFDFVQQCFQDTAFTGRRGNEI